MNRLDILDYIYAIDEYSGKLTKVKVEEYSIMRDYTMVIVQDRGLVSFHGGKYAQKNRVTYYLKPEYIKQQFISKTTTLTKELKNLESSRDYYLNEYENYVRRINEIKNVIPKPIMVDDLIQEEKEIITAYHKSKL